jgi:hypothetical protein
MESPTGSSIILIFEADDQIASSFCPETSAGEAGEEPVEASVDRSQAAATARATNSETIRFNLLPPRRARGRMLSCWPISSLRASEHQTRTPASLGGQTDTGQRQACDRAYSLQIRSHVRKSGIHSPASDLSRHLVDARKDTHQELVIFGFVWSQSPTNVCRHRTAQRSFAEESTPRPCGK